VKSQPNIATPRIFLDNHSTTRVDDRVLEAMVPFFLDEYGNAASRQHEFGWIAAAAVEKARRSVASLINAEPAEVFFASGATEANNLALKGLIEAYAPAKSHVITVVTEHPSVLDTCARLEAYGCTVTRLGVDASGLVDPDDVRRALTPSTLVVSVMFANNEIGTVAPIAEIAGICHDAGVFLHTDATQALPYLPIDVHAAGIDLLTFSGHKCHGPKGIGGLFVRRGISLTAQMDGGSHEKGMRSGTLNVPGIVGMGEAFRIIAEERERVVPRVLQLRDRFAGLLRERCGEIAVNGHHDRRLPNNLSVTFAGVRADRLMMEVRRVAMSTGSACGSASPEPSYVLRAIGLDREAVASTIRFGLSKYTREDEIDLATTLLAEGVRVVRSRNVPAAAGV